MKNVIGVLLKRLPMVRDVRQGLQVLNKNRKLRVFIESQNYEGDHGREC